MDFIGDPWAVGSILVCIDQAGQLVECAIDLKWKEDQVRLYGLLIAISCIPHIYIHFFFFSYLPLLFSILTSKGECANVEEYKRTTSSIVQIKLTAPQ